MIQYIPLYELPVLVLMILVKTLLLRRKGIIAFVFGSRNKNELLLVPVMLFFLYALLSGFWALPFPSILEKPFWKNDIIKWMSAIICSSSLIWFGITLKVFGNSFRIGIDQKSNGKLITTCTFAYSRNPVFLAFIAFFTGYFVAYPNVVTLTFLVFLTIMIHRQILREETYLKHCYGNEYDAYCKKVRRYL
jgi:protein-S-isoprenylcysteine O-methyltransferase Ste14